MCLKVREIKTKKPNKYGVYEGWKVIRKDNTPVFYCDYFTYKIGENIADIPIREIATTDMLIHYGLHLFLTREDARAFRGRDKDSKYYKIIKVFYKPEDVVAYGITDAHKAFADGGSNSVVVKKLIITSLEPVR